MKLMRRQDLKLGLSATASESWTTVYCLFTTRCEEHWVTEDGHPVGTRSF